MGEARVLDELLEIRHFHRLAIVHAEMALRDGEVPIAVCDVDLGATGNVLRPAGTDFVCVVTRARTYASRLRLTITEKKRDRIVRMARLRPVRSFHFAAVRENNLNNPLRI